jgi:hypothetical protein
LNLRITQAGRLRLYRLRDEILQRDRVRDDFGVLWAHRHWLPDLTVRLRLRDPKEPLSLIVLDVDHLKKLNTDLGHPGANTVLTGILEIMRDVVQPHEHIESAATKREPSCPASPTTTRRSSARKFVDRRDALMARRPASRLGPP